MKKLVLILGALVLAALIALRITTRKGENDLQAKQEAQPTKTTRQLRPREAHTNPASVGTSEPQTQNQDAKDPDLILFTNWDDKIYKLRRVVTTNYSVRPTGTVSMLYTGVVPVGPLPPARVPTPEEAQAAREARREELREKGEYKEMFAKEDAWREKSTALRAGMTVQEVIAVMGLPTQVEKFVETSKESSEAVPVPTNEWSSVTGMAIVTYSPDGKPPLFAGTLGQLASQLPFDHWILWFDEQGKLIHK